MMAAMMSHGYYALSEKLYPPYSEKSGGRFILAALNDRYWPITAFKRIGCPSQKRCSTFGPGARDRSVRRLQGKDQNDTLPTVAANSATGCENPKQSRREAPQNLSWRFFSSSIRLYGGCAWETFGSTGCLDCRFLTPRTAVTQAREKARGSSSNQGSLPMTRTNPLKICLSPLRNPQSHNALPRHTSPIGGAK